MLSKDELRLGYKEREGLFNQTCIAIHSALELLFQQEKISILRVTSRVKTLESFIEKVSRKEYDSPFDSNEDFCGIRVITFYPEDLVKIDKLIRKEFEVLSGEPKEDELEVNQLGYRSNHYVCQIKKDWASIPNYRGIQGVKFEIQVRTVLMHAWSEIQYSLGYKAKSYVPKPLLRKVYLLSGLFELADEQLQQVLSSSREYDRNFQEKIKTQSPEATDESVNLNNLKSLLKSLYPDCVDDPTGYSTSWVLEACSAFDLRISDLVEASRDFRDYEKLIWQKLPSKPINANMLLYALELKYEKIRNRQYKSELKINDRKNIINFLLEEQKERQAKK